MAPGKRRVVSLLLAVGSLLSLSACDLVLWVWGEKEPIPSMTPEAIATREAPPELVFRGQLAGQPVDMLVHDCEVFHVERLAKGGVKWTSVLEPDFYPLWTSCIRQSLEVKQGAVTVTLGRQAFGAGGCCATGGVYRSVDGINWKKIAPW